MRRYTVMAHFHQRRRTRIRIRTRIPNPFVTLYYAQFFTLVDSDLDPSMESFPNGSCTHFRDGSPSQGSESESASIGGNEPLSLHGIRLLKPCSHR